MFSETLMDKVRGIRQSISPAKLDDPLVMRKNLEFIAAVIKATPELLLTAADNCGKVGFDRECWHYLIAHYSEERQHYEWLMADLGNPTLGVDWIAAELAGSQYYLMKHFHPTALLGYMAVLEGDPVPMADVERLEAIHGGFLLRTIRFHAEHDLEHRKELFALIDKVPSSLQSLVMESAMHTLLLLQAAQKTWS